MADDVERNYNNGVAALFERIFTLQDEAATLRADLAKETDEAYQLGKRDGYESAVQDVDLLTGGDGEYRYCTDHDPDRHTPDADSMKRRIQSRFEAKAADLAKARQAMRNINPYLAWTIGTESPGYHPTMPSAVAEFQATLKELRP